MGARVKVYTKDNCATYEQLGIIQGYCPTFDFCCSTRQHNTLVSKLLAIIIGKCDKYLVFRQRNRFEITLTMRKETPPWDRINVMLITYLLYRHFLVF